MVEIRRVNVDLVNIKSDGTRLDKNDPTTTIADLKSFTTEHRVTGPATGPAGSPNAVDYPTIEEYLAAEAVDGFMVAHMDHYFIVTQKA